MRLTSVCGCGRTSWLYCGAKVKARKRIQRANLCVLNKWLITITVIVPATVRGKQQSAWKKQRIRKLSASFKNINQRLINKHCLRARLWRLRKWLKTNTLFPLNSISSSSKEKKDQLFPVPLFHTQTVPFNDLVVSTTFETVNYVSKTPQCLMGKWMAIVKLG